MRFSTTISLHIGHDTRYNHSSNGRQIGTHAIYQMAPFPMTLSENPTVQVMTFINIK